VVVLRSYARDASVSPATRPGRCGDHRVAAAVALLGVLLGLAASLLAGAVLR
jgi:hypothetical protein